MTEQMQKKLVAYIEDAHAMEQSVLKMLDGMISSTKDAELRAPLENHRDETREHASRLERRLDEMGEDPSALKNAGATFLAMPKGLFDQLRGEKPARNARDGYVTEYMEIAAYQLLERVALRAGDESTAEVARLNRRDEERMARQIDASWDRVVELTLAEEGVPVR